RPPPEVGGGGGGHEAPAAGRGPEATAPRATPRRGARVPRRPPRGDPARRGAAAAGPPVRRLKYRAGQQRLDAAALAAVAGRAGGIDRVVTPLARDVLRAAPEPSVDDDPAADAGAEDHAEDH